MPTDVVAGDVHEVRIVCKAGTQYSTNVRHFRVTGVPTAGVLEADLPLYYGPKISNVLKGCIAAEAVIYGYGVRKILPTVGVEYLDKPVALAGTGTGGLLPEQTAGVISLRTTLPGKKFRGRMYVPFPHGSANDVNGRPTAIYTGNIGVLGDMFYGSETWTNGANSFTSTGVVYHRGPKTETTLSSIIVRKDWGTQRRRSQINHPDRAPF